MGIGSSIAEMRGARHISQETLATALGVSKQAVQKWESQASLPDTKNLLAMADYFHVPLDALVFARSSREYEEMSFSEKALLQYHDVYDPESYMNQLDVEYQQCMEEGRDVTAYKELFSAVQALPDSAEKAAAADIVFSLVSKAAKQPRYPYNEPSSLEGIREQRQIYQPQSVCQPNQKMLKEKISGAWIGRICGCLLGKPIECIKKEELTRLLKETGNYPLHRYLLSTDISEEVADHYTFGLRDKCYADTLKVAPVDDDTNYTVLAMKILQEYGDCFTPENVAEAWKKYQSVYSYFTAERVAYKNAVNGLVPPYSAFYKNPFREWIGAQIRADYYGYICPGDPQAAAEMAWRDASISHVKNGIYGAMFVAAMLAGAAVCDDVEEVIRIGLGEIPAHSRLYESVQQLLSMHQAGQSYEDCIGYIAERYDDHKAHDWCHTLSNAMIVVTALLYGNGQYGRSICLAVQAAFDTDCNGATVGSIIGMMKGQNAIESAWIQPLHGQLETSIFGVGQIGINELVEQTLAQIAR